jgi:hypothetical protein
LFFLLYAFARLLELEGVEPVGLSLAVWRRVKQVVTVQRQISTRGWFGSYKESGACEVGIRDLGRLFWDFEISNVFQKRRR